MNILVLLKLLSAHFLADFFLQTDALARNKQTSWKSLTIHSLINAAVAYLFLCLWAMWIIPVIVFVSHFLIDLLKIKCGDDGTAWFIADQTMHIGVIILIWTLFFVSPVTFLPALATLLASETLWATLLVYGLMTMPASMFIERFFRKWIPEIQNYSGLSGGGKWIGYLERMLIVTFVLSGNIAGVGFLMTAKSVFRFSDVQKGDLRMTEYMLLGTLLSFAIALAGGFLLLMI